MAHGYSAVKEMYLDRFAEVFAAAGLAAIVFDNRNFGASGGEPFRRLRRRLRHRLGGRLVSVAAARRARPCRTRSTRASSGGVGGNEIGIRPA
jgi:predicted alpha/beta hydrolase